MRIEVTAVVVSYNREELLAQCLDGLAAQTRPADRVLVIDNASTDGAVSVAKYHKIHPEVVQLPRNVGGAGGFAAGIAAAIEPWLGAIGPDGASLDGTQRFVWLMDDDTVPQPPALERLLEAAERCVEQNGLVPTALGSKAVWTDGREHLMNRPRPRTFVRKGVRELAGEPGSFQVRSLSFVSCLLNAGAIVGTGRLPRAAYFLWNDDFEYTTALLKNGIGYYIPESVVVHKTKVFGSSDADPGARFYNEVRNKIWLWRFSRDVFTPLEAAEFLAKTARRWVLTALRASDRALIADCLRRGWHDGWKIPPERTQEILRSVGVETNLE